LAASVSVLRRNSPLSLRLLPEIAEAAPLRAAGYGLPFSSFAAVLVWNDTLRPARALAALPRTGKIVRQPVSCSLRGPLLRFARRRAREQAMSVNAYLEAIIAAQLALPRGPLVILNADRK
jgi:hypothetical protein